MVGHPEGDNDFGNNKYLIYVSKMARKDCFNKPNGKLIILDDYKQWNPRAEDLQSILTGQAAFDMKNKVVLSPALPCIFITNDLDKYNELFQCELFNICLFWKLTEPLYKKGVIGRNIPDSITPDDSANRTINDVLMPSSAAGIDTTVKERLDFLEKHVESQAGQIVSLERENSSIQERLTAYEGMNNSQAPKEKLFSLLDSWKDGQVIDQNEFLWRLSSKLGDIKEFIDQNTPPRSPQQDFN